MNPSYIAETVTRQLVGSYTKLPALMDQITYFTTLDPNNLESIDYYQAGFAGGQIASLFLDFTINN